MSEVLIFLLLLSGYNPNPSLFLPSSKSGKAHYYYSVDPGIDNTTLRATFHMWEQLITAKIYSQFFGSLRVRSNISQALFTNSFLKSSQGLGWVTLSMTFKSNYSERKYTPLYIVLK
jgi:hypothetical protein